MRLLLLTCALISLVPCSRAPAENLLKNGGFEEGTAGWVNFWGATGSLATDRCRTGTNSALVTQSPGRPHGGGWAQTVEGLEAGAVYRADAYVYRDDDTVTAYAWMIPQGNFPHPRDSAEGERTRTTGTWEHISCEMPARMVDPWQGGSFMVHIVVDGPGKAWIDDVSLTLVKTRLQRKAELGTVIAFPISPPAEKAQAYLALGEIAFAAGNDLDTALANYGQVLKLAPGNTNSCLVALSSMLEVHRRKKDFSSAAGVAKRIVDDYSITGTLEGAKSLARLGEALEEEADALVPDYAAALQRLDQATNAYHRAIATYTAVDAAAHVTAIEIVKDRLLAIRHEIGEYGKRGGIE